MTISHIKTLWLRRADIDVNGKRKSLGYFKEFEDAKAAYRSAAISHFGDFARFE